MSTDGTALESFDGKARLFPLPNLVIYPHIVQPLHIFEARYRQMVADALEGDRLIAMAVLHPGWEQDYEGQPSLYPVACLGRIVAEQQLPDGRYNILLRGLSRMRIDHELPHSKLYRIAKAELIADVLPNPSEEDTLRQRLLAAVPSWFAEHEAVVEKIQGELGTQLPLGVLSDVIAFALAASVENKQALLAEVDVERRVELLFECATAKSADQPKPPRHFPPDFSSN